jgi:DNA-binding transcriptional LysR family regulator
MTLQQMRYAVEIADCGSINEAAKKLFISQPSLSGTIKDLENELDITLFLRSNRGITITPEGAEFLGYARQILEQYRLMEDKFISPEQRRKKFSVSMQHYTFAVQAFIRLVKRHQDHQYAFAVHETRTYEVIRNVATLNSEIGVLYVNDFNRKVLMKLFRDSDLEFIPLFECPISVYFWKNHPLAGMKSIAIEQLKPYPCLSFEQGENNSFHFAEEVLSTYDYDQIIKADDRATMLNLMVGLNAYTLCSGIICEDLNGEYYRAVPLETDDTMTIGYIKKKRLPLSQLAEEYVLELLTYGE